jgi:hypothetical protein
VAFPVVHRDGEVWNGAAVTDLENRTKTYVDTFAGGSWKAPVATASALPSVGNADGDAAVVLDTVSLYIYTTSGGWRQATGAGGGGGPALNLPLDGGDPTTTYTEIVDAGTPSTTFTLTLDGGTP